MHIFFSGIGGAGIGPLALIAHQAGFDVSGSDKQTSDYITYLKKKGLKSIYIGQTSANIAQVHENKPIDWLVYSSAVEKENPNGHPEIMYADEQGIRRSKRDIFLSELLKKTNKKLIAVAGTQGKTTTTAMIVWLLKELREPVSYSVGAKIPFGEMGEFNTSSEYFVYEADEYDRNFLSFKPHIALISGIDYDHPDIYPTRKDYYKAFRTFIKQSKKTFIWQEDAQKIGLNPSPSVAILHKEDYSAVGQYLSGKVNRENASLVVQTVYSLDESRDFDYLAEHINDFPGASRRFEEIVDGLYSDYAHTPEKIRGALQIARETAGDNVVVIYEGLHNTRQHFIIDELHHLFDHVKHLYVVPSYRAREDETLEELTPKKLIHLMSHPEKATPSKLGEPLADAIRLHLSQGSLVLALSAGGGGSLDEWLRKEFK